MSVVSVDELAALSKEELEAVVRNVENPIDVRRLARTRLNAIWNIQPHAELYQTVLIVPDVLESADEDLQ
jgi:hypothetical protein